MREEPKITVLMSVYNAESYLQLAAQSILDQTFHDFEFLIIDDGSTDGSVQALHELSDERVRVIRNPQNFGLTKSLNIGIREAKGRYIARLDADDIASPERLSKQAVLLDNNPTVGMVTSWRQLINANGEVINTENVNYTPEDYFYLLHFRNCIIHSSVMFRRELVLTAGGYDEKYLKAQDFELWNRLSKLTQIMQISQILVSQRQSHSSISHNFAGDQAQTISDVVKSGLEKLKNDEFDQSVLNNLMKYDLATADQLSQTIVELEAINDMINQAESETISNLGLDLASLSLSEHVELTRFINEFKKRSNILARLGLWKQLKHKSKYLKLFI